MSDDISMKNTKKEMLDLIETLKNELNHKEKENLNPEKIKQEAKQKVIVEDSDKLIDAALATHIHQLKVAINKELTILSDKLETEAKKYQNVKNAIEIKQAELNEIYGVEKEAAALAIILEAQKSAREDFENEMQTKKEQLENELIEKKIKRFSNAKKKSVNGKGKWTNCKIKSIHFQKSWMLQQEKAYEKVQDIANKAVSGATERLHNITVKTTPEKQS